MAQTRYRTLSRRVLDRLSVNGKDTIFRDRDLAGFGVRVYPSEKKVFVVRTRAFGRSKRVTLGTYPKLTPDPVISTGSPLKRSDRSCAMSRLRPPRSTPRSIMPLSGLCRAGGARPAAEGHGSRASPGRAMR